MFLAVWAGPPFSVLTYTPDVLPFAQQRVG
jgi:hypothetical protein